MTRSGPSRTAWGAGLLSLALAGGMAPTASAAPVTTAVPTAAGDPVTVVSTDFTDGSWAPWESSGGPALSVVEVDGDNALLVGNRVNDYDGIQTPAGTLEPGGQYTFSMQARLAEGTTGTTAMRFVVTPPGFTWVGNTEGIDAAGWTEVEGTFTVPADAPAGEVRAYIGTGDLGAPYSYLLDDLLITRTEAGEPTPDPDVVPGGAVNPTSTPLAAARGTGDVAALTFDDGPNPGETDTLLDLLAEKDLTATFCVIGQNITAPGGAELLRRIVDEGHTLCNHTTSYADMGSWTPEQVRADLVANLQIIRDTLGDPDAPVPYFRAPNGSWGQTGPVAASLGMQPLGLGNVISDWDGNDLSEATLTTNLRAAFRPGAVVLVHDGGGNRENGMKAVRTVVTEKLAEGWTFTLPQGGLAEGTPGGRTVLSSDFEDGLDGWVPRGDAAGDPTVAVTTTEFHGGAGSALVSDRSSQGDGLLHDLTGLLQEGTTYEIDAWVKFAPGAPTDAIWLSVRRDNAGTASYDTVAQVAGVTATEWTHVVATYEMGAAETAALYFETAWPDGSAAPFLVDDVVVRVAGSGGIEDLAPLKSTVDFPVGVAIDERETGGAAADLVTRHFDQITGENHMKPYAWYGEDRSFRPDPQATGLMQFAQANDIRVYGHTLVWHGQTPEWFFQNADGAPLTSSEADKQTLRDRLRRHIFDVAEALSTGGGYGEFGSGTNPLVAFDVVNEVVSDGTTDPGGLRQSEWYRVLGEDFIDLAFRYADDAFNDRFAVEGDSRPVALTINDYNTEQSGKQERLHALVERLLARGVPVDNVGHQFHVSLAMPVQALEDAIVAFQDLPVKQVVSELDVTTGTPVTDARLIEQGYYYRDAFAVFREHSEDIFSVTVWGLTDGRSWVAASGAPLLFTDAYTAKPAFRGAAGLELPAVRQSALVFRGDVALAAGATGAPDWSRLPLTPIGDAAGFALRWEADHLTAYVRVTDATVDATDAIELTLGDRTYTVGRNGEGDVESVVEPVDGGYAAVVHLPLEAAAEGDELQLDVRVTDGGTTTGWNSPGAIGTLSLVEPLSSTEVVETAQAPTVDGTVDAAWSDANTVTTETQIEGTGGATATVRTLWRENTLYVLAEVADPVLDKAASDPWQEDSVEIFLDAGNVRAGGYRDVDTQIRINFDNETSFGTGDQAAQQARLTSATRVVDGGYVVEAAIDLLGTGGVGTVHGLDLQVNDASNGARTGVRSWADPTGLGYQSTARWGVAQLVAAETGPEPEPGPDPVLDPSMTVQRVVRAGDDLDVALTGFAPGSTVHVSLRSERGTRPTTTTHLGEVTIGADGSATAALPIAHGLKGVHTLVAHAGDIELEERIVIRKPTVGGAEG